MSKIPKIIYWLPTFIWLIVIFTFSAQPTIQTSAVDWQDFFVKKTAHFIEYAILTGLFIYSLSRTTRLGWSRIIFLSIFVSISYAISDEFHQSFVPGREARVRDILIDSFGSLSVGLLSSKIRWLDNPNYRV